MIKREEGKSMKNKQWGKMLSLFVAASMVFSVTVPAYAQPAEDVVELIEVDEAAKADAPEKVGATQSATSNKYDWRATTNTADTAGTVLTCDDDLTFNITSGANDVINVEATGKKIVETIVTFNNASDMALRFTNTTDYIGNVKYKCTNTSPAGIQAGNGTVVVTSEASGLNAAFGDNGPKALDKKLTKDTIYDFSVAKLNAETPTIDYSKQTVTFENPVKIYKQTKTNILDTAQYAPLDTTAKKEQDLTGVFTGTDEAKSVDFLVETYDDSDPVKYGKFTTKIAAKPKSADLPTGVKAAANEKGEVTLTFDRDKYKPGFEYLLTQTASNPKGSESMRWQKAVTNQTTNETTLTTDRTLSPGQYYLYVRNPGQDGSVIASDWTNVPITCGSDSFVTVTSVFDDPGWTVRYGSSSLTSTTGKSMADTKASDISVYRLDSAYVISLDPNVAAANKYLYVEATKSGASNLIIESKYAGEVIVNINSSSKYVSEVTVKGSNVKLGGNVYAIGKDVNFAYKPSDPITKEGTYYVAQMAGSDVDVNDYIVQDQVNDELTTSGLKYLTVWSNPEGAPPHKDFEYEKVTGNTVDVMTMAKATEATANDPYAIRTIGLTASNEVVTKDLSYTATAPDDKTGLKQTQFAGDSVTFKIAASNVDYMVVEDSEINRKLYGGKYVTVTDESINSGTTVDDQNVEYTATGLGEGKTYAVYIRSIGAKDTNYSSRWTKLTSNTLATNVAGLMSIIDVTSSTATIDLNETTGFTDLCIIRGDAAPELNAAGKPTNVDTKARINKSTGSVTGLEPATMYTAYVQDLDNSYHKIDTFITPDGYNLSGNVVNNPLPVNSKVTISDNMGLSIQALSGNEVIGELQAAGSKGKYAGYTALTFDCTVNGDKKTGFNPNATPETNLLVSGDEIAITATATIGMEDYVSNTVEFTISEAEEKPEEPGIQVTVGTVADQKSGVSKNEVEEAIKAATTVTAVSDNSSVSGAEISVSFDGVVEDVITVSDDTVFTFTVYATKDGETVSARGSVKVLADKPEPTPPVEDKLTVEVGSVSDQQSGVAKSAVETDIKAATTVKDVSGNTVSDAALTVTWDGEVSDNIVVTEDTTFKFTVTAEKDGISGNGLGQVVVKKAEEPTPSENKLSVSVDQIAAFAFGTTKADIEAAIKKATTVSDNTGTVSPDSLSVNWTTAMADGAQEPAADTTYTFTVTATKAECTPGTSTPQTVTVKAKEAEETHKEATVEGMGVESDIVNVDYNPSAKKQFTTGSYLITFSDGKMIELEINGEGGTIGDLTDDDYKNAFELKKVKYKNNKKAVNKKSPQVIPTLKASKGSALKNQIKALNKAFKKTELGYFTINPCDVSSGTHSLEVKINTKKNVVKSIKVDGKKVGKKEFTSTAVDGGYQIAFSGNFAGTIVIDTNGIIIG